MKISGLKTFLIPTYASDSEWALGKAFLLIKVETDSGLSGWGEAYVPHDCEHAIDALIRAMARYLEGTDPLKIEKFRHNALNAFANLQTGFHLSCAIAGIEMALWDITGLAMEQPVYRLLGSPCRTQVPVYANCHSNKGKSIDDIVEYAKARYAEGFLSVKIYPFLDQTAVEQGQHRTNFAYYTGSTVKIMLLSFVIDPGWASQWTSRLWLVLSISPAQRDPGRTDLCGSHW